MKKILKINFNRCFSTSHHKDRKPTISFKYKGNKDLLKQRLKEILFSYYNMNYSFNVLITYVTFKGNLTLQLYSDIISKSKISDFDSYITEVTDRIYELILDWFSDERSTEINRKAKINLYIDAIKYYGDISSNKIPSGKRKFSTLLPINNSEKSFVYEDDILYLENKLEEIVRYRNNNNNNGRITLFVGNETIADNNLKPFINNLIECAAPASKRYYSTKINKKDLKKTKLKYDLPWTIESIDGIDYGRNFGKWKCLECNNHWSSAYTWISLDFCENNTSIFKDKKGKYWFSGKNLKDEDFLLEKCRNCEDSKNSNVTLLSYNNLEGGDYVDNKISHHAELCAKCLKGNPCQDTWND